MRIEVEIAPGEFFDKLTILEIKSRKIFNKDQLKNINNELKILRSKLDSILEANRDYEDQLSIKIKELRETNLRIWEIEDAVRDHEREQKFDESFIEYARSVYITNDSRATIKREINELFQTDIKEEKSYTDYNHAPQEKIDHVEKCNELVKEHTKRNNNG